MVPLNTPVNYGFFVGSKVLAASPDTRRTSITVHFASDRSGVFNLPDGYTANSPSLNIVDNVWIPPCAADLNGDGSLNFFDVSLFLSLFSTHDAQADLAPPTGQWDFFDVMAYLEAFSDGCP